MINNICLNNKNYLDGHVEMVKKLNKTCDYIKMNADNLLLINNNSSTKENNAQNDDDINEKVAENSNQNNDECLFSFNEGDFEKLK